MAENEIDFDLDEILESTLGDLDLAENSAETLPVRVSGDSSDNIPKTPEKDSSDPPSQKSDDGGTRAEESSSGDQENSERDAGDDGGSDDESKEPSLEELFSGDAAVQGIFEKAFAEMNPADAQAWAQVISKMDQFLPPDAFPPPSSSPDAAPSIPSSQTSQSQQPQSLLSSLDEAAEQMASSAPTNPPNPFGEFGGADDPLAALLSGFAGLDANDPGSVDQVVDQIMKSVMTKEVMSQPIKDITEKYPKWLKENEEKVSDEDMSNYQKQYEIFQQICIAFDNDEGEEKVSLLMQEMQNYGQPPEALMEELLPGMNFDGGVQSMMKQLANFPGFGGDGELPSLEDLNDPEKAKAFEEHMKEMDKNCSIM